MIYHHSRIAGWYPSALARDQHADTGRAVKGAPYFCEADSDKELHEGAFLPCLRVRGTRPFQASSHLLPYCYQRVTNW
jgi:hypothetical protein